MDTITLKKPDDWHLHVRDGEVLTDVVPHTARQFSRAILMPNLKPPVTNVEQATSYRKRVLAATPPQLSFDPLMVLYLTDMTQAADIFAAAEHPDVYAVKLYPAGATTNSASGVTDVLALTQVWQALQETGLPLLVHGEVTHDHVDIFDREAFFIEQIMQPLLNRYPDLNVVFEHITTRQAAEFVAQGPDTLAATITAHHLLMNRNDMLAGGIRPHYYCLPILKRETHRQALVEAATSGSHQFFLGTDSAPHPKHTKLAACGCAGVFTAHAAIELYAEVFDQANALDQLEAFASLNGPRFYNLPVNEQQITLTRADWRVPDSYQFGDETVIPFRAGELIRWQLS